MAVEPISPEPTAPRFPPLPGSLADAWNRYRLLQANDGHEDNAGVPPGTCISDEEVLAGPANSLAELEVKLRIIAWLTLMGGMNETALAAISVLGPLGHPLDAEVRLDDYRERIVWSALQDVIRFNREAAK